MKQSIIDLAKRSLTEDIYPENVEVTFDPDDDVLYPEAIRNGKRIAEFMAAQPIALAAPDSRFIGMMRFRKGDKMFPGPLHSCDGHVNRSRIGHKHYLKPDEGIVTFEAEHGVADFGKILRVGVNGLIREVTESRDRHSAEPERCYFLGGAEMVLNAILDRSEKCAEYCEQMAEQVSDPARRNELMEMSDICRRVPANPATTFREAVQCVYFCYQFLPDSIGSPDRYLRPFFERDLLEGRLTVEQAENDLGELFCMLSAFTPYTSVHYDKGGECHFVVGGYLPDHTDGYCSLSRLILDSMMKLPLVRPQITVRWTPEMPSDEFYHILDLERNDPGKRLAFCNDVPRIKGYMEMYDMTFEEASRYIVTGCNEPAFGGSIDFTGAATNVAPAVCDTFRCRRREVIAAKDFNEFYAVFEQELFRTLSRILEKMNMYNTCISRDIEIISSCFMDGCIERGLSSLAGGCSRSTFCMPINGYITVIDSLSVVNQFVFEEKLFSMAELCDMLDRNWQGSEDTREHILKHAHFFGNDTDDTNAITLRVNESLKQFALTHRGIFGTRIMFGDYTGYWEHNVWFGELTPATPDGRYDGDPFVLGISQTGGKDREGMTALFNSVKKAFENGIMSGSVVFNLSVDENIIRDDDQFEKFVRAVETYFRGGGLMLQLNYVSREELLKAKKEPDKYKSLRVRVSGYSGYFVRLDEELQDDIIARTSHAR